LQPGKCRRWGKHQLSIANDYRTHYNSLPVFHLVNQSMRTSPLALLPLALACSAALAQPPAVQLVTLDRLTVVGDSGKAEETAGSAAYIDEEALEKHGYRDAQRILRQV